MNFRLKPFRATVDLDGQAWDAIGEISSDKFVLFFGAISFALPTVETDREFAIISEGDYPFGDGFMLQVSEEGPSPGYTMPGCELCLVFPQQPNSRGNRSILDNLPSVTEVNLVIPLPLRKSISFCFTSDGTYNGSGTVGSAERTNQETGSS